MMPLKQGSEIRVIAPSFRRSNSKHQRQAERAKERLEGLGYKVTFGKHLTAQFHLGTARAEDRIKDLTEAYSDKSVNAIMAFTGGWSANELLPLMDWKLIKDNPKPLIGFSDITVLLNAIYSKTGCVGYLGPNFSTLGKMTSWQYTLNYLDAILRQDYPLKLSKSKEWSVNPSKRFKTKSWRIIQEGEATAIAIGGNIGTFYLLQGTEFQPTFTNPFILIAEDDDESGKFTAREFSRRLESILQLPNVRKNMKGIIIGRFQPDSKVKVTDIINIITAKKLVGIPIVANIDFGHTVPMLTLPIGGQIKLIANGGNVNISITG